ncbi:Protein FLX-like 1 [Rhynchospora pubera]|uniref:Protein FLX-like 1 n=1 Tax=Rhynchospora pubera TaxID=906938 RepID=A0AAV8D074_9POAL|nr:Protein FLX-like 1 [Rhynchospora pubera]
MAGRSRLPPPSFTRGAADLDGPPPRPHLRHPPPPPPHVMLEERMAVQFDDVQALLSDNQRLAATHVALKQEVQMAQYELRRASVLFDASRSDADLRLREVYEKMMKLESELGAADAMRADLMHVRNDIQRLTSDRQDLLGQVQALTQDLTRASTDARQVPAIKSEIETLKKEIQQVSREGIEQEKKGYAENYEQGQVMEKNLISMAREIEKLRSEIANAEKRARAAAAAGTQAAGLVANYGNPDPNFMANPYAAVYGMNPVAGVADPSMQYGLGAYDMQGYQGRR